MAMFDIVGVLYRLEVLCEQAGGQSKWATKHGITQSIVSDVLRHRRMPGPSILKAMGMSKVTLYMTKPRT